MNRLRQTGVFFLVLLMLAGTAGFNIWDHVCACQPVVEVKVHSCCEMETPAPVKTDDACGTGCESDHKGCKDVPVYFKASIVAIPVIQKVVLPGLAQGLVAELPFIPGLEEDENHDRFIISHDKPPPRAGKDLVFFLHQLRIPFSS